MLTETALDILHFFSRVELEGMQMHSRFLRDFVDRNSSTLPLRRIYRIRVDLDGGVNVRLERDHFSEDNHFEVSEMSEESLGLLLDRVNNAFIERLTVSFIFGSDGARLLGYLRDHASALKFRIKVLCIPRFTEPRVDVDYALVDFVACHLKPHALYIFNEQISWGALLDHVSIRSLLRHVRLYNYEGASTPLCMISALPNVDTLQTCAILTYDNATPWIVRFANAFEVADGGARTVRSVAVVWDRRDDADASTPTASAFSPLGIPQRKGIPAPRSHFVRNCFRYVDVSESTAELFVFKNSELGKRLDIYKWNAEATEEFVGFHSTGRFDVFLLQIIDI